MMAAINDPAKAPRALYVISTLVYLITAYLLFLGHDAK
jgi:hypothetical protein